MRLQSIGLAVLTAVAACGGDSAGTVATVTTITPAADTTVTLSTSTTATTAATGPARVVAIVSGRGDDGTFEVVIHLDAPLGAAALRVGIDADDSYSGAGDPGDHLEGWVTIDDLSVVGANGEVAAAGEGTNSVGDWVAWSIEEQVVRVFFFREVAPLAGTLWVVVGDGAVTGAIASIDAGESCSAHGTAVAVPLGGAVPEIGVACRY